MRTQHVLVQELENMRQDVTWVQERLRLMQLAQGCHPSNAPGKGHQFTMHRDWDNFHKEVLELLNPSRAKKKLTKFFGDEPPLIRQFLKRLGYEKYAANFESEKIGIKELPYLTEERLQKMGIPMGPRIRILQEAQTCCPQNQYKVYIV
ncbi:SAM domain-containing protein [Trichonephila clavipes]|nr:SAM domain-containing protein [Trichonephila clavipes]